MFCKIVFYKLRQRLSSALRILRYILETDYYLFQWRDLTNTHTIANYFLLDRLTGKQFDLNMAGVNTDRKFKKAVKKLNEYMAK